MTEVAPPPGLLLVGHGTRSGRGTASVRKLAEQVAARVAPAAVEAAFLEMQEPTIAGGLNRLAERGARQVVALPLLLFSAGHDKQDIPEAIRAWRGKAEINVALAEHLGCDPAMVELSARRFTESLSGRPAVDPAETVLLLAGRGSRDAEATIEMHQFARLLGERIPVRLVAIAFLAMAEPLVGQVLTQLGARNPRPRRVVVQPHLLFHGDLVERLRSQVAATAANHPQTEWVLGSPLCDDLGCGGPADELFVPLLAERYHQAAIRIVAKRAGG
jgi:sirohydrochlorin cobaltochelatase